MDSRTHAISILKRARQTLLDRLAERVIEGEADILDDAEGESFHSELEAIHEQIGQRLANVNSILSALQYTEDSAAIDATDDDVLTLADQGLDGEPFVRAMTDSPTLYVIADTVEPEALTRHEAIPAALVEQLQQGNAGRAAAILTELFAVCGDRAARCLATWQERSAEQPELLARLDQASNEGSTASAATLSTLLSECFGLSTSEAASAARSWREQSVGRGATANCDAPGSR